MTDELHDALKNARPDAAARARGMDAAMAAFDAEFGKDEKNTSARQGSQDRVRPTDQKRRTMRPDPRRRRMTTRLSNLGLKIGGTGIAAILALAVVFQYGQNALNESFESVSGELAASNTPNGADDEVRRVGIPGKSDGIDRIVTATPASNRAKSNENRVTFAPTVAAEVQVQRHVAVPGKTATFQTKAPSPTVQQLSYMPPQPTLAPRNGQRSATLADAAPTEPQQIYSRVRRVTVAGKTATITTRILQEDGSIKKVTQLAPAEEPAESLQIVPGYNNSSGGSFAAPAGYKLQIKPATYKTVEVIVPVLTNWKGEVLETRTVQRRIVVTPSAAVFVPIDPNSGLEELPMSAAVLIDPIHAVTPSRDRFADFTPNPVIASADTPVSTFSIDVDTAAYSFLRSTLNRGQLPRAAELRVEELVNYFPYDYPAPDDALEPFKSTVSVTPTPWNENTQLMHIGIKGYTPPAATRPRSNLVLLIDTSGSMNAPNKLPLLVNSFRLLLDTLDADDTVSIVTYAGSAGTVLEPTPASERATIERAFGNLRAGGSTAGAAGLRLAYRQAAESFDTQGINRVILATDGDFNVGFSSPDAMKAFVEKKRKSGVFLSVLGFGRGNYNDALMQALAQNGNGVAAYIDTLSEARKVLAGEAGGALVPIAKDVKIQVEFNPATISEYRLIGYETRALNREDFNNDAVDAGDINSGHTVTAIYEVTPKGSPAEMIDPLRYGAQTVAADDAEELAFVKIRHKLPDSDISTLQTRAVTRDDAVARLTDASADTRFAVSVAALGQMLRGQSQLAGYEYDDLIELAAGSKGDDPYGYRAEFVSLVRLAKSLDRDR